MRRTIALIVGCSFLFSVANAEEADRGARTIQLGNVVTHHRSRPDHNNRPHFVGLELRRADDWFTGAATFVNSYRQRSGYAYLGRRFDTRGLLYAKVTGGLLVGYRGEYRDKIPFKPVRSGTGSHSIRRRPSESVQR